MAAPAAASSSASSDVVFEDVVALLGPELVPTLCSRVVVSGGKIAAIETEGKALKDITTVSTTSVLMPAMTNGHTHLGDAALPDGVAGLTLEQAFFRPHGYKYRMLSKMSDEDLLGSLKDALMQMARAGITSTVDFREQGIKGARLLREASEATGVRAVILSQLDTSPFKAEQLTANTEAMPPAAQAELADMLEVADGFSESTMNDLTDNAWEHVRKTTEERGKVRAIHCLENEGYRSASMAMASTGDLHRALTVYNADLVVHMTVATDEEIAMAADSGVAVCINPRANMTLGLPIPPVAKLVAQADKGKMPLLIGTDNGMLNSPSSLFAELDTAYKLGKSQSGVTTEPSPTSILKLATVHAGTFLSRHGDKDARGYLDVGARADLVELDFSALHLRRSRDIVCSIVTRCTHADVKATYAAGKRLYPFADTEK